MAIDGPARALAGEALDTTRAEEVAIPSGLGWDNVNYPLSITVSADPANRAGTSSLTFASLMGDYASRPTYWVDVAKADDTGDGLTEATAKRTIAAAVTLANTGAVPARIRVKAGLYTRNRNFSAGAIFPTVDIVYEAYGGRAIVTASEDLTWALDGTYTKSYKVARSNTSRIFDLLNRDRFGHYVELIKVADAATVDITPNSWAQVSGDIYARRADGAAVANANTRVMIATDNFRLQGTSQQSVGLTGETAVDGFDIEGGQAGALRVLYTGGAGGARKILAAKNCTFRYSGHLTGAVGNVAVEGFNGLCYFENCDASAGATDCFNWHNALGADMYVLTVNCTGFNGGRGSYVSCNGWTGHDTVIGIDVCGDYRFNRGRTVHWIDTGKFLLAGSYLADSLGDRIAGGSNDPGEITVEDAAEGWGDLVVTDCQGGRLAIGVYETGAFHRKRMVVRGIQYAAGTATLDTY